MAESDNNGIKLFGFELKRQEKPEKEKDKLKSIVAPTDDDGAGYVTASGSHYGQYIDMEGNKAKDNQQLIIKYRGVATHPEVDAAIEDIVNESIVGSEQDMSCELNLDKVEAPNNIKKQMTEEFNNIYSMLNFGELGHDIFRSFYVDGRVYHHLVVNESNLKAGIQEIRTIDAAKIRKVKEVSGLLDPSKKQVVSYLHKALKPINQLRMMEDSLVIYRLARAPERRIFYIDVGNMPRNKSEAYMKDIMSRYRNKIVYDSNTGQLKDDRKHMSMLEDFWLPRREGGRGTEISTLPGGENLGQIDDIIYFQKRLYRSLNVPVSRLEQEAQFTLGRSTEIGRDEVKFQKFIDRLRRRFSTLFTAILKKQLILKGVITEQDWAEWKGFITVDFQRDNHFTELKDAELLQNRLQTLDQVSQYVGEYFSREWAMKNVMMMSDEDIEEMKKQVEGENATVDEDDEEVE